MSIFKFISFPVATGAHLGEYKKRALKKSLYRVVGRSAVGEVDRSDGWAVVICDVLAKQ